jgi:uncharacterized protein YraI
MKSIALVTATLALVAAAPVAQAQYVGVDYSRAYRVSASKLNVRTGPSARAARVGSLSRGTVLFVHRFQSGWAQITFKGKRRWTSARYLTRGTDFAAASTPTARSTRPARRVTNAKRIRRTRATRYTPRPRPAARPAPARPAPTLGRAVPARTYRVSYSRLRVRTSPSTRGRAVASLGRGTRLQVTRQAGSWNGFVHNGRLVWAYGRGMQPVSTRSTPPSTQPILGGTRVAPYSLKVRVNNAALRTEPSSRATRIRGLVRNQVVNVILVSGNYRGVQATRSTPFSGWVHVSLLEPRAARPSALVVTRSARPSVSLAAPIAKRTNRPSRTATRRGSKTRSVGNKTLGASITRSCTTSHSRTRGGTASESWSVRGKVLGSTPRVASRTFRAQARAGGEAEVVVNRLELIGREFRITTAALTREQLWLDDQVIWRGAVGPVPLALKVDAGVRAEIGLSLSLTSQTLEASAALFGAAKVEIDALIVRAGVKATLNLIEVSLPATLTFSASGVEAKVEYVLSSNVRVGVYAIIGRKVFGIGFEKEFNYDIPFLQYTLAELRVPILSASVSGS